MIAWVAVAAIAFGAVWVAGPSLAGLGGTVAPTVKGPKPLPGALRRGRDRIVRRVALHRRRRRVDARAGRRGGYEIFRRGASEEAFTPVARLDDWRTTSYRDVDLGVDTGTRTGSEP